MSQATPKPDPSPDKDVASNLLPGPDRLRRARAYRFRLVYRNPKPKASGCIMLWEVTGGRLPYQIAWERATSGASHLHCTCADAVFRGENSRHVCKHVRGLLALRDKKSA
jgi:hypothetical protein